jgi:hypothetical protein
MDDGDDQGVCNPQYLTDDPRPFDRSEGDVGCGYETGGSEGYAKNMTQAAGKRNASVDEWEDSDFWDDGYLEDDNDSDGDYEGGGDDGDDDDGEYTTSRRRISTAGKSRDLRPRRRASTSARYRPYPDSNDTSSTLSQIVTQSSSPPLGTLPKTMTKQTNTLPIPVPNLTKKSRGRHVPTVDSLRSAARHRKGKRQPEEEGENKNARTFVCDTIGCGKCFARGEHLKRHIRSIHTYEKRELLWYLVKRILISYGNSAHLPTPRL